MGRAGRIYNNYLYNTVIYINHALLAWACLRFRVGLNVDKAMDGYERDSPAYAHIK